MLNRLFAHKADGKDGLTQAQREAIVDVLHYCMYADNFIALSESRFIAAEVDTLNWDPNISFEYYQNKSIGAVRAALAGVQAKEKFFESVKQRLNTTELRKTAFALSHKLFLADGNQSAGESVAEQDLRISLAIT